MTLMGTTVLSVRGDARLEVPPDLVTLNTEVSASGEDKAAALRELTERLDGITDALAALGGTHEAPPGARVPLNWRTHSMTTRPHVIWEPDGRRTDTGLVAAVAGVQIQVRDFALLERMNMALAGHDALSEFNTYWSADPDNPAWPQVRAQAIQAAIAKGRDYAAALDGTLIGIEHIADAGLLGGADHGVTRLQSMAGRHMEQESAGGEVPSLDPVPITLMAVIDARFTASVPPLT